MNERIRKLIRNLDKETGRYFWTQEEKEKFSELIVRECAKVLEIQGSNTGHEQYHYGASLIEEHFGVE